MTVSNCQRVFQIKYTFFSGVCCPNAATVNNSGIYLFVLIQVRMEWVCFGYLTPSSTTDWIMMQRHCLSRQTDRHQQQQQQHKLKNNYYNHIMLINLLRNNCHSLSGCWMWDGRWPPRHVGYKLAVAISIQQAWVEYQ